MRKTNVTRWCAMMIAFLLILGSLAAPVRALGPNSSASLIITGLDPGAKATFYKIIGVNLTNGQPADPMYIWTDEVASYVLSEYPAYVKTDSGKNAVAGCFFSMDGGTRAAFLKAMRDNCRNQLDSTDPESATADAQGTISARLPLGYYLIEVGENYLLMTGSVFPKYENGTWVAVGSTASAKQEASSDLTLTTDGTSVTVGELVNYTLTLKAPRYPDDATQTGLCISVKLPEQMALNAGSVQVTGLLQSTESALSGYTVETSTPTRPVGSNQGLSFAVTCPDHTGYLGKDTIQVTFSATAGTTIRDGAAMTATAYLDYHANGYERKYMERNHSLRDQPYLRHGTEPYGPQRYGSFRRHFQAEPGHGGPALCEGRKCVPPGLVRRDGSGTDHGRKRQNPPDGSGPGRVRRDPDECSGRLSPADRHGGGDLDRSQRRRRSGWRKRQLLRPAPDQ